MQAAVLNIVLVQGSTFVLPISIKQLVGAVYESFDLTGYNARGSIRKSFSLPVLLTFTPVGSFDTTGTFSMTATAEQTGAVNTNGVYDIEIYNGSIVTRILQGTITISKQVTYG